MGVLQGLLIYDGEGNVIYSRELEEDVALEGIAIAKELGALTSWCMNHDINECHAINILECCTVMNFLQRYLALTF